MADVNVNIASLKKSYSLKNKTSVSIEGYTGNFADNVDSISVSGSTLVINLTNNKKIKLTNIANPKTISFITDGTQTLHAFYDDMIAIQDWTPKKGVKVTGSVFDDVIDLSETDYAPTGKAAKKNTGLTINAGGGNDTITGTGYNDTIIGGLGNNTIVYDYNYGNQGQDVINLTNGEHLTIDLTAYGISTVNGFLGLGGGRFKKSGNDLILRLSESTSADADFVKIKNFYKQNGAGTNGSVKVLLKKAVGVNPEVSVNLNEDAIFSTTDAAFVKGKRMTASFIGSRFSESIDITSEMKDYTKTIKAGAGVNTINIKSDDFGKAILSEDKLNATNIINLYTTDYNFKKNGNDLIVFNDNSELKIIGYYLKRTAKTKYAEIKFQMAGVDKDIEDLQGILQIEGKGKLYGTEGNDNFTSTTSNDVITGYTGENKICFDGKFGKDTVNLTAGERLVLDMSAYGISEDNISYYFSKGNLVITVYSADNKTSYGTVTLKNFAKSDVTGSDTTNGVTAGVFLKLSNTNTVDLREKEYDIVAKSSYTGNWHDENIQAYYAKKSATINAGKGDDTISAGGGGKYTFVFNTGDGNDVINYAHGNDVIQINTAASNLSYGESGNDLIIKYSNNDSITVKDFYLYEEDLRINTIKALKNSGKYETIEIDKVIEPNVSDGSVFVVNSMFGDTTISAESDYDTIKFTQASNPEYVQFNRVTTAGHTNDLLVRYSDFRVTLTDYFLGNHSVKSFKVSDPYNVTYDIPYKMGTSGNDTFGTFGMMDEYYYLNGGNDTITFDSEYYQGSHDIIPTGTYTGAETTTIQLNEYSLEDDDIKFSYMRYGVGTDPNSNRLDIYFSKDNSTVPGGYNFGSASYEDYFCGDKPTLVIQDKTSTYSVDKFTTVQNLNWSEGADADKNHVSFLFGQGDNVIVSNNKTNYIYKSEYEHNTTLDYKYVGGHDKVISKTSADADNDSYTVNSFTADTNLVIFDAGGDDSLNINTNKSNIRLFFDIIKSVDADNNWIYTASADSVLVHYSVANTEKLLESLDKYQKEQWVDGTVVVRSCGGYDKVNDTVNSGLEALTASDGAIDLDVWKAEIAQDVCSWFANKFPSYDYASLSSAIEAGAVNETELSTLLGYYNQAYTDPD